MGWWGKAAGGTFGFMLGGPIGAMLGTVLGHNLDKGLNHLDKDQNSGGWGSQERVQTVFFTATFSVMGHIAKADGRISEDEIKLASDFMVELTLDHEQRRTARDLFMQGKEPGFELNTVLSQLRHECGRRQNLIRMFIEIQVQLAYADGSLHHEEHRILKTICDQLGVSRSELDRIEAAFRKSDSDTADDTTTHRAGDLNQAYAVLGVSPQDNMDTVKRTYRRLINQHYPDKLVAKGLPEEMMKVAQRKTHEIRSAYETIRKART